MSFFYAKANATQSLSGYVTTEMVFGNEVSDPDSGFASNRFTVPSAWNGRIGGIVAGHEPSGNIGESTLRIEVQIGGSGGWVEVAGFTGNESFGISVMAAPIEFSTGDVYRVTFNGAGHTKPVADANFFSGWALPATPEKLGMFRAEVTANNSGSSVITPTLGTEIIDSQSAFASSVFTVPSSINGGFLVLQAAVGYSANNGCTVEIQRSTDGGTSWTTISQNRACRRGAAGGECTAIVVPAVTDDKYRIICEEYSYFGLGSTFTTGVLSHFSGLLVK